MIGKIIITIIILCFGMILGLFLALELLERWVDYDNVRSACMDLKNEYR